MLIISDIHLKEKMPYRAAIENFFKWVDTIYPDENIIFLGDVWDSSSPTWNIFSLFTNFASNSRHAIYVLEGNHTYSKRKGTVLNGLYDFANINTIIESCVKEIEGNKCLFLPYLQVDNKNYYENEFKIDENNFDFIFTHLSPKESSWGNEGIDFDKIDLQGTYIHGHIHTQQNEWHDKNGNRHIILGCPIPTRHGEQNQEHRIARIKDKQIEFIKVPQYFTYETIEYGTIPSNPNNVINVKNVPSWESLYKTYKDYYIREEGVEFIKTENDMQFESQQFEKSDLKSKFKIFSIDRSLNKEISDKCFEYIDRYENKEE